MVTKADQSPVPLADDVVGPGVHRIAAAAGLPTRITRNMIDEGDLPAFKIRDRWYARISEMAAVLTAADRDKAR